MLTDLIFLSTRKLLERAEALGIDPTWWEMIDQFNGEATATLPFPGAHAKAQVERHASRVDEHQRSRQERELLRRVNEVMQPGLPDLEARDPAIADAAWFSFERAMNFGIGAAEDERSIRAFLATDSQAVTEGVALVLHGAPDHVLEPYRLNADVEGGRSGSGSGRLFRWLHAVQELRERDASASILRSKFGPPSRFVWSPAVAFEMYAMFTRPGTMTPLQFPQLLDQSPCRGIAQVTHLVSDERCTVVFASPLYVERIAPNGGRPRSIRRRIFRVRRSVPR